MLVSEIHVKRICVNQGIGVQLLNVPPLSTVISLYNLHAVLPLVGGQSPEFRSSFNPITTRGGGADYAQHITASPPGFENPAASL